MDPGLGVQAQAMEYMDQILKMRYYFMFKYLLHSLKLGNKQVEYLY